MIQMKRLSQTEMEDIAVKAIQQGKTRGGFIRENTFTSTTKVELQDWSNAYSWAIRYLAAARSEIK